MKYFRLQLIRQLDDKCISVMVKTTNSAISPQDHEYYLLSTLTDVRKELCEKDEPDYIVVLNDSSMLLGMYKRVQNAGNSIAIWSKVY